MTRLKEKLRVSAKAGETELTCKQEVAAMADFTAHALPPEKSSIFEAHLDRCPACTAFLRTYRETVRMIRALQTQPPPKLKLGPPPQLTAIC